MGCSDTEDCPSSNFFPNLLPARAVKWRNTVLGQCGIYSIPVCFPGLSASCHQHGSGMVHVAIVRLLLLHLHQGLPEDAPERAHGPAGQPS